jgi:hypothetical protein
MPQKLLHPLESKLNSRASSTTSPTQAKSARNLWINSPNSSVWSSSAFYWPSCSHAVHVSSAFARSFTVTATKSKHQPTPELERETTSFIASFPSYIIEYSRTAIVMNTNTHMLLNHAIKGHFFLSTHLIVVNTVELLLVLGVFSAKVDSLSRPQCFSSRLENRFWSSSSINWTLNLSVICIESSESC